MDVLVKSYQVLVQDWAGILGILGMYLLGSLTVFFWLKTSFGSQLTTGELVAVSFGGGYLPLFLGILPTELLNYFFGLKLNFIFSWLFILILSGLISYWAGKRQSASIFTPSFKLAPVLALFVFLIFSIYLRLAFIAGLTVPLYFDSNTHYAITQGLIANFETSTLPTLGSTLESYYHLGFHVLAAAFSLALQQEAKDIILIFGQIVLASLPLPLYFMVKRETDLEMPAIYVILLAGWGWPMPAYVINWGKYPALTSILAFEFVLCCAYLLLQSTKRQRWLMLGLLGLSILASTFIHTRSLILIILALISGISASGWLKLPSFFRNLVFGLILAGLVALTWLIASKPMLEMAFDPYRSWMTLLVLSLSPFALKEFPRAAFSGSLFVVFIFGSLFFPIGLFLPGLGSQTLLDRPFVQMILFFPLAFLGGLGYAGLTRVLNRLPFLQNVRSKWAHGFLATLCVGAILFNLSQAKLSPSDCCNFFRADDLAAFDWMDKNLPANAKILVASSAGSVLENGSSASYSGSDAGIWVTMLLHRNSIVLTSRVNFETEAVLTELCKYEVTHIYVGSQGEESFNPTQLRHMPEWYELLLELPQAQVFKLVGCH